MGNEGDGSLRRLARWLGDLHHRDQVTAAAVERAREAGVEVEVVLRAERPVDALLSLASERDARLIVVGTYGESPLRSAILGSTPHKLLHLSKVPLLVVPPPR